MPLGLINDNWGGTPVEHWSTPDAFDSCGRVDNDGTLYNAMIAPYVEGPMAVGVMLALAGAGALYELAPPKHKAALLAPRGGRAAEATAKKRD